MKNICPKCKKSKVTYVPGKTKAYGTYIPCGCKLEIKKVRKQVFDKMVMEGKKRFIK